MPAPASTAGMVNTPVPTMLPMTSPVAEVSPNAWAFSLFRGDIGRARGVGLEADRTTTEPGVDPPWRVQTKLN